MGKSMTPLEFVVYWTARGEDGEPSLIEQWYEGQAEAEAQYRSECALFGDAGPGQGLRLREGKRELAKIERQIARCKAIIAKG